jgi:hypothetical protein
MSTTYGDLYDNMLDGIYEEPMKGLPFLGCSASKLMKEMAPTDYRVGFADWLDSVSQDEQTCTERGCRNKIDPDTVCNAGQDDDMVCGVCAGTHFECGQCNEIKPNSEESETTDLCASCFKENEEEEDEGTHPPEQEDEDEFEEEVEVDDDHAEEEEEEEEDEEREV